MNSRTKKTLLALLNGVGAILVVVGILKVISALGTSDALQRPDPLLGVNTGRLMFGMGVIEVVIGGMCLFRGGTRLAVGLLTMLATNLLLYRLGLVAIHFDGFCNCLGSVTDAIHMTAKTADNVMKVFLAVLLVVAYGNMFAQGLEGRGRLPWPRVSSNE